MSGYVYLSGHRGWMEPARTLAFGAVVANYAVIGTPLDHPVRIESFYNTTDIDVWVSLDGVTNHFLVLAGGGSVRDNISNGLLIPKGTQFYVKRFVAGVAPTSGTVVFSTSYQVT